VNIFDHAMRFEKEGAKLYREFARKASTDGLKTIFSWLALQEDHHCAIIAGMKAEKPGIRLRKINYRGMTRIFRALKKDVDEGDIGRSDAKLYRMALAAEKRSMDFYSRKARTVRDGNSRKILFALSAEEKKHYTLIDNLIEFITEPETWVENAEFARLDRED